MKRLVLVALLAVACGSGAPAASSPSPAPTVAPTPTAAPSSAPSPSSSASVPGGYSLFTGAGFEIALPDTWAAAPDPQSHALVHATSPLGGTKLDVFPVPNGLASQGLAAYCNDQFDQIDDLWATQIIRTETTVAGVPALRGEAFQTKTLADVAVDPVTHVLYCLEAPAGSGDIWEIGIDTLGQQVDPAESTIMASLSFR